MKSRSGILLCAALSLSAQAWGQVTVLAGKRLQIPEPGATAAVSLDASVASASMANNVLNIVGVSPGDVRVIALYPGSMAEVRVHVLEAPPVYPPGFTSPQPMGNGSGSEEVRYSSDRMQLENLLDINSQGLLQSSQLHVDATSLPGSSSSPLFLPSAYFRISTEGVDLTFLDQTVADSPLTLEDVVLRGFHMRDGQWQLHAGYTSSASFADVLIPVQKEFAAGVSYSTYFHRHLRVVPHAYLLRSIDLGDGKQHTAFIGSLLLKMNFAPDWKLVTEIGFSRSPGFAAKLEHNSATSALNGSITAKAASFPSVRTSSLPGLNGSVNWTQALSGRFGGSLGATVDRIHLPSIQQDAANAYGNLRFKFSKTVSFNTGVNLASFASPSVYSSRTLTLPEQVNFDRARFGLGLAYQFATRSHGTANGSGERQTLRLNVKRFEISEFADMQKDAAGISLLASQLPQLPQLQHALQRQAITITGPDQMAALLHSAVFLETLGVSKQPQVVTVPERTEEGAALGWSSTGARPHQLNLSLLASNSRYEGSSTRDYSLTGSYIKQLGTNNLLQVNGSIVQSSISGQKQLTPIISVSLRHTFAQSPEMFSLDRNHTLSGTVFIDSKGQGSYEDGMQMLPDIAIVLDGKKTAVTDALGNYSFSGVGSGNHRLQVHYKSDRPHYFTSPQDTIAEAGSIINFGIRFPSLELWGYVKDDAGMGMEGVQVRAATADAPLFATTDRSGKFLFSDVKPGSYAVEVSAESVAIGHATEDLTPVQALVTDHESTHPLIEIPAIRILTGSVTTYDAAAAKYVAVRNAKIYIKETGATIATDRQGNFTLGGLPYGSLEITLTAGSSSLIQTIFMPVQPITIRKDYKVSALNGAITSTPPGAAQIPRRPTP